MREIFVFGSNLGGRHGKGAALHAIKCHGAIYGQAAGLQGCSYAIPTKDARLRTLSLQEIKVHVGRFLKYAFMQDLKKSDMMFHVTPVGCGLAGYHPCEITPLFKGAKGTTNIILPEEFLPYI